MEGRRVRFVKIDFHRLVVPALVERDDVVRIRQILPAADDHLADRIAGVRLYGERDAVFKEHFALLVGGIAAVFRFRQREARSLGDQTAEHVRGTGIRDVQVCVSALEIRALQPRERAFDRRAVHRDVIGSAVLRDEDLNDELFILLVAQIRRLDVVEYVLEFAVIHAGVHRGGENGGFCARIARVPRFQRGEHVVEQLEGDVARRGSVVVRGIPVVHRISDDDLLREIQALQIGDRAGGCQEKIGILIVRLKGGIVLIASVIHGDDLVPVFVHEGVSVIPDRRLYVEAVFLHKPFPAIGFVHHAVHLMIEDQRFLHPDRSEGDILVDGRTQIVGAVLRLPFLRKAFRLENGADRADRVSGGDLERKFPIIAALRTERHRVIGPGIIQIVRVKRHLARDGIGKIIAEDTRFVLIPALERITGERGSRGFRHRAADGRLYGRLLEPVDGGL